MPDFELEEVVDFADDLETEMKHSQHLNDVTERELIQLNTQKAKYTKARWVLVEVARISQKKIKYELENITTKALRSIFKRDFSLVLDMRYERNVFECKPLIKEDGELYVPKDDLGGSLRDVVGFVLRIVFWHIEFPRSRNTVILDEPFKSVGKLSMLAGTMLKEISRKLCLEGLQIIMLTHDEVLAEIADVKYLVERDHTGSHVMLVKGDFPGLSPPKTSKIKRVRPR